MTRKHLTQRAGEYFTLLRPVRAYAFARLKEHPKAPTWQKAFVSYHEQKAMIWDEDVRAGRGKDSLRRFAEQYPNFHAAADLLLSRPDKQAAERAWQMLCNCNYLYGWNGLCLVGLEYLLKGYHAARAIGSRTGEANCLLSLGDLSFRMSENEAARLLRPGAGFVSGHR